jgi:hypothetical protein
VFKYLNENQASNQQLNNRQGLLDASEAISNDVPALAAFHAIHNEFDADWYETRTRAARNWLSERIIDIIAAYNTAENNGNVPANAQQILLEIDLMYKQLSDIKAPPGPTDD